MSPQARLKAKLKPGDILQKLLEALIELSSSIIFFVIFAIPYFGALALVKLAKKKPINKWEILSVAFSAIGFVCFIYSWFEPYQLGVTEVNLTSPRLKAGQTLRIVHLTDLHCDGVARIDARLPQVVHDLKPDLIVFTGDATNNANGVRQFDGLLSQLSKIAPGYAVFGNHDDHKSFDPKQFADNGFVLLEGKGTFLKVRDINVFVDGFFCNWRYPYQSLQGKAPGDYSILLNHYPDGMFCALKDKFDLFLCGHTHGGQVRVPFYGALVTESNLGKKYEYGTYHVENTDVFVSRGLGMTALPIRFLAPPEVALIVVSGNGK